MRSFSACSLVLGILAIALPAFGAASEFTNGTSAKVNQQAAAGQMTAQTPEVLPPADSTNATGPNGPSSDSPSRRTSNGATSGYAYSDKPTAASRSTSHRRYRATGPVVNLPGFEQTADGGSRLFVQLSQSVPVEERKAQGSLTYVLKGASPRVWNNTNALVTVHFNTPVSRARLVPQGSDLLFVVDLRAAATPTWKMTETQDKSAMLVIDFPKGEYLQTESSTGEAAAKPQTEAARPAPPPKPARGKRGAARPAPTKKP